MDQELQSEMLAGSWWTLLHMRWVDAVCTHQMAALFGVKWRHGRNLKSAMSDQKSDSMHTYLENNRAKFHSDSFRNDGALGFF